MSGLLKFVFKGSKLSSGLGLGVASLRLGSSGLSSGLHEVFYVVYTKDVHAAKFFLRLLLQSSAVFG